MKPHHGGGLLVISGVKRLEKSQRGASCVAGTGDILHDTCAAVDLGERIDICRFIAAQADQSG